MIRQPSNNLSVLGDDYKNHGQTSKYHERHIPCGGFPLSIGILTSIIYMVYIVVMFHLAYKIIALNSI